MTAYLWIFAMFVVKCGALQITEGDRLSHPLPSVDQFEKLYSSKSGIESNPVVLGRAVSNWPAMKWDLDNLKAKCGKQLLERPCQGNSEVLRTYDKKAANKEWGGMVGVNGTQNGINSFGDFVDAVKKDKDLYLHDASIDAICPELLNDLRAPKWFQLDLQKHLPDNLRSRHKCNTTENGGPTQPSIFVGRAKSVTGLHIDSRATRFWMAVLSGSKTFRLVHPRHIAKLSPTKTNNPNVVLLGTDLFDPEVEKDPKMDGVEVLEFVLESGDLIYIPEGWPHQVKNNDRSIAVSYNFVDLVNRDQHTKYLQTNGKFFRDGPDKTISQLQTIWMKMSQDFPVINQKYSFDDVSWKQFFHMQRTNASEQTLFDNMTPEQSQESLRIMEVQQPLSAQDDARILEDEKRIAAEEDGNVPGAETAHFQANNFHNRVFDDDYDDDDELLAPYDQANDPYDSILPDEL